MTLKTRDGEIVLSRKLVVWILGTLLCATGGTVGGVRAFTESNIGDRIQAVEVKQEQFDVKQERALSDIDGMQSQLRDIQRVTASIEAKIEVLLKEIR